MKIDLGCGKAKKEGFIGVDVRDFEGVDVVCDLGKDTWPWQDDTVEEAHASHFVEHLKPAERIHFANELWRVMKKGAKCQIITPHWNSARAYGDLTHEWPPVCEWWYFYLNAEWRKTNAPHNAEYLCDFDASWGYGIRPDLTVRAQEYQQYALANFKEAAQDLAATVTKR